MKYQKRYVVFIVVALAVVLGVYSAFHRASNKLLNNPEELSRLKIKTDSLDTVPTYSLKEVDLPDIEGAEPTRKDLSEIFRIDEKLQAYSNQFPKVGQKINIFIGSIEPFSGIVTQSFEDDSYSILSARLDPPEPKKIIHLEFGENKKFQRGFIISEHGAPSYKLMLEGKGIKLQEIPKTRILPDDSQFRPHAVKALSKKPSDDNILPSLFFPSEAADLNLQSLPGAPGVIYLDFDGHVTANTLWNAEFTNGSVITSSSANLDDNQITEVWKRVSEIYSPFSVNVTTDESIYNVANANTRMRVVFTSDSSWLGPYGGVAYLESWNWGTDTPCFVFTDNMLFVARYSADGAEHELGHVFGVDHDGHNSDEYYVGLNDWAPIMGASYYRPVTQFSKGEYLGATNLEDDLQLISNNPGAAYRTDLVGDNRENATDITSLIVNDLGSYSGVIEKTTDQDVFSLHLTSGILSLNVHPPVTAIEFGSLNVQATLVSSSGMVIEQSSPTNSMGASFTNLTLQTGDYYLIVDGVGDVSYTDYGSIGSYRISGTFAASATPTPSPTSTSTPFPTATITPFFNVTSNPTASPAPTETPEALPPPPITPEMTPNYKVLCENPLAFEANRFTNYSGKRAHVSIRSRGIHFKLKGKSGKLYSLSKVLTKTHELRFEFKSNCREKFATIGFDTVAKKPQQDRSFALDSSCISSSVKRTLPKLWGDQTFANSGVLTEDGWKRYTIPLGNYFEGEIKFLSFITENLRKTSPSLVQFRNVMFCYYSQSD